MDKKYIELLKEIAQATAVSAETVMEYDKKKGDDNGYKTATIMRDDYQELFNRIDSTEYIINKSDAAKFLVGALIQTSQLQDRMNQIKAALTGFQTDIIPKLQKVVDSEDDEAAKKLVDELFIIEEKE